MMNKLMNLLGVSSKEQVAPEGFYQCRTYPGCSHGQVWYCPNSTASGCIPSMDECC